MSQHDDITRLQDELRTIAKIWESTGSNNPSWDQLIWNHNSNSYGGYYSEPTVKEKRATRKQIKKLQRIVGEHFTGMSDEELLSTKGCSFELQPHDKTDQMICLVQFSNKRTESETIHCFEGEEIFDIYTLMQVFEIEETFTKIKRQVRERIKSIEKSIQMTLQERMVTGLNFDLLESGSNDHDMTLWG